MSEWLKGQCPFEIFSEWYDLNLQHNSFEPTAMTLATVGLDGIPSARVVLLKEFNKDGFCFFTNYESHKGHELANSPRGALVFHWEKPKHRQVRVRGLIEKLNYQQSNQYFQKRVRGSQIGAWASPQSQVISSREELQKMVADTEQKFADTETIPCPENWGGYCLHPLEVEFWEAQEFRLHDRLNFKRDTVESDWTVRRLAP